jgi:hypothetical protein
MKKTLSKGPIFVGSPLFLLISSEDGDRSSLLKHEGVLDER